MTMPKAGTDEQARLMAEMESEDLQAEVDALRREVAELRAEADLDACHIAGLTAQIKALIAESEACANHDAHRLVEKIEYVDSRSGKTIVKTRALPLYREAFDAEARSLGIVDPERFRS